MRTAPLTMLLLLLLLQVLAHPVCMSLSEFILVFYPFFDRQPKGTFSSSDCVLSTTVIIIDFFLPTSLPT